MQDHPKRSTAGCSDKPDDERLAQGAPEPPRLNPKLPAHPAEAKQSSHNGRDYGKAMIASSAASVFLTPIVVLCLGGYWLDQRMRHATPWLSMVGVIVGLALGTTSLVRVLEKLSK